MKRFIINLLLFCIPMVIWLFVKWTQPYDLQFAAHFTQGDCSGIGRWVHDRIVLNKTAIDVAFIGTSHTIDAIDDKYLSEHLNSNIVNLGYCHLGRNLQSVFVEMLLSREGGLPKKIILEIRENEEPSSHSMFPYWASFDDMWQMPYNRDYFSDWYTYSVARIEYSKSNFASKKYPLIQKNVGYWSANKDTINPADLNGFKERHQKRLESVKSNFQNTYLHDFTYNVPTKSLKKIHQLCQENNIKLEFIYLPDFASMDIEPLHLTLYQSIGKVIIPPQEIWNNSNYWHDKAHLNLAGSKAFSSWLSDRL